MWRRIPRDDATDAQFAVGHVSLAGAIAQLPMAVAAVPADERRGDDLVVGLHGGVREGLAADAIGTDEQFTHLANHRGTGVGG